MKPSQAEIMDTQRELFDHKKSKAQKYQDLFIGERGFWKMVKYELIMTLCSWVPGALGILLRSKFYPRLLGKVGRNVAFGMNVAIRHPGKIFIGDNVVIDDHCVLDAKGENNKGLFLGNGVFVGRGTILTCHNGDIVLEDNCNIGFHCVISSLGSIVIKKNNLMAAFCYLVGGNHDSDRLDIPVLLQGRSAKGIVLEENIWLGAAAKVLDGVTIGRDCIIGAGSLVTEDIPAWKIAVGTPAKVIKDRREMKKNDKVVDTTSVHS